MGTEAQAVETPVGTALANIEAGLKGRQSTATATDASTETKADGADAGGDAAGGVVDAGKAPEAEVNSPERYQEELVALRKRVADFELADAERNKAGEVDRLKAEVGALKAGEQVTAQRRLAEDTLTDFVRSPKCQGLPVEFLRKMLPVTADKKLLDKEFNKLGDWMKSYIQSYVERGVLSYRQLGGSPVGGGDSSITLIPPNDKGSFDNIQNGLRRRAPRTVGQHLQV